MPRTVERILQHAEELATRFDGGAPACGPGLDQHAVGLLRAAVAKRSEVERQQIEAVTAARKSGMSWSAIGDLVGTSGEAARQRYAGRVG